MMDRLAGEHNVDDCELLQTSFMSKIDDGEIEAKYDSVLDIYRLTT